ncbi:MAG: putative amidohydrolase YtcJ [Halioglobus sp.]|jgi:predicted amidohydrolase YtcJ
MSFKRKDCLLVGGAIVALTLVGCSTQDTGMPEGKLPTTWANPTTVYFNGEIVTVDDDQPSAEAIAVRDGRILAVGSRADVDKAAGKSIIMRDLLGGTMLPGLIDAHGHISMTNKMQASANVSSPPVGSAESIDDIVALLKAHRLKYPGAPWLTGWGYDESLLQEQRHPTREDLDRVSNEVPIMLVHVSGHFMTCNSACLALAGITADSEDPKGGIIRRLPHSREPDGVLEEQAMAELRLVTPALDDAAALSLLDSTQQYYASQGITTVQDGAAIGDDIRLMKLAGEQGLLYLDVVTFPYAPYMWKEIDQYPPSSTYDNHVRIGGFKLVLDGSPQGKTAWLTKPYLHPPHGQSEGYAGYATLEDDKVGEYIEYAFANDIPVLAHANGDAASDQLINAVSAANVKLGKADRRTVMIHAQTVREDQIKQMVEEGINPSYFVVHTFYWGDWHRDSVFGAERASRISPLRSSTELGLRYTIHNDTPIVPPDMMRLLWSSVNRVTRSGKVLGESQSATVMEGIRAMTIDAAHQYFEEGSKGSIKAGKRADLVILDRNPLKVDAMSIKDISVLETIKDGVTVFKK